MADSNALRSRRRRLHAAGDHSICTSRCAARAAAGLAEPEGTVLATEGTVTAAVAEWVRALRLEADDPRRVIAAAAMRLAAAVDAGEQLPAASRELRAVTGWMREFDGAADRLDKLRARRAARRVEQLLGT